MASVYILYSDSAERFYIGVTKDLFSRINFHQIKEFPKSFTAKHNDWSLFFSIDNLTISTAYKIEKHIKRMKSKIYLLNLKSFPELSQKLVVKYS